MVVLDPEHAPGVLSDASLVADAQRGSAVAFATLYERHQARILQHCRNRIGANDAADAAQETFLRAWRALDGFGGDQRVYPWLRMIATNVCIDILRRRGRSFPVAEVDLTAAEEELDVPAVTVHAEAMTAAMARLSDRHRSVLHLREFEGWTYERIADHEQLDLSAVKSLLWRARQSLRREFFLVSAQGRLSALAGILSFGRLRSLLADLASGPATVGAGGAAATAVAAAAVAVPALVTGSPPPPPAPPAVAAPITVPAPSPAPLARRGTVVARAGGAKPTIVLRGSAPEPAMTMAATPVPAEEADGGSVPAAPSPPTTVAERAAVPRDAHSPARSKAEASPDRKPEVKADRKAAKDETKVTRPSAKQDVAVAAKPAAVPAAAKDREQPDEAAEPEGQHGQQGRGPGPDGAPPAPTVRADAAERPERGTGGDERHDAAPVREGGGRPEAAPDPEHRGNGRS